MDRSGPEIGEDARIFGRGARRSYAQKSRRFRKAQDPDAIVEERGVAGVDDDLAPVDFGQMLDEVGDAAALRGNERVEAGEKDGVRQMFEVH